VKVKAVLRRLAAPFLVFLLILGIIAGIGVALSWVSIGIGDAVIIVSQISGSISQPRVGPTSGFMVNGFWRIIGQEYPVVIKYQRTDENILGMWGNGTDKYADYPAVACFSKDQLEMLIDIMLRWELDTNKLVPLFINYPTQNWKNIIASIAREQMRIITSTQFKAVETIEQRDVVQQKIQEAIIEKISSEPSLVSAVINIEFELRNIGYPAEYTKAITDKMAAQQQLMQAEFEAQKVIVLAKADAEKVLIQARAVANATIIQGQGLAQTIQLISEQTGVSASDITALYLWLQTLKDIEKPTFILFMGNATTPFLFPIPSTP